VVVEARGVWAVACSGGGATSRRWSTVGDGLGFMVGGGGPQPAIEEVVGAAASPRLRVGRGGGGWGRGAELSGGGRAVAARRRTGGEDEGQRKTKPQVAHSCYHATGHAIGNPVMIMMTMMTMVSSVCTNGNLKERKKRNSEARTPIFGKFSEDSPSACWFESSCCFYCSSFCSVLVEVYTASNMILLLLILDNVCFASIFVIPLSLELQFY
jgi:hypothetical protein